MTRGRGATETRREKTEGSRLRLMASARQGGQRKKWRIADFESGNWVRSN